MAKFNANSVGMLTARERTARGRFAVVTTSLSARENDKALVKYDLGLKQITDPDDPGSFPKGGRAIIKYLTLPLDDDEGTNLFVVARDPEADVGTKKFAQRLNEDWVRTVGALLPKQAPGMPYRDPNSGGWIYHGEPMAYDRFDANFKKATTVSGALADKLHASGELAEALVGKVCYAEISYYINKQTGQESTFPTIDLYATQPEHWDGLSEVYTETVVAADTEEEEEETPVKKPAAKAKKR